MITPENLRELAGRALTAHGMSEEDAALVADVLVLADLFGIRTHGVARNPQYLDRAELGGVDVAAKVVVNQVTPALPRWTAPTGSARWSVRTRSTPHWPARGQRAWVPRSSVAAITSGR